MGAQLLEIVTVGLPFCGFKFLAGGSFGSWLAALGALDAAINLVNFAGLLLARRRLLPACALSCVLSAARGPAWRDLGDSLDVLASFVLVALMVGLGRIPGLEPGRLVLWNLCVILNVLGAGLGRVSLSVGRLRAFDKMTS